MGDDKLDVLNKIIDVYSREIKEESDNIRQILLTLFSAYTKNPQNTRILAPSGEGKTYLVTKVSELFPQEHIKVIARATPQSFKYTMSSKKVIENGSGNWQDYDVAIEPLEEELAKTKDKEKQNELKQQIQKLRESAYDLVDFTNMIIILVDSQSFELFESLKTTLSHDKDMIQSFSVNKTQSGTMKGQRFLIKGFPAVIYCSAKDEQQKDETNEINTRFNTISLNASTVKYRKMLELEALHSSLPNSMYQEEIISDDEKEQLKDDILEIINQIKNRNEVLNPFGMGIQNLFKDDAGHRTRQLKVLNNNITMLTLINSVKRPKIIFDGDEIPVTLYDDIKQSAALTKQPKEIQSYKIKLFNENIRKFILDSGTQKQILGNTITCLTATEISEMFSLYGIPTDRQRLQETILKPLVQHGYLEEYKDPDNHTRHVYAVTKQYTSLEASIESTLIDVSTLDMSCAESFIEKYVKQRFDSGQLKILDHNGTEITIQQLVNSLGKIDVKEHQDINKSDNIDSSTDIDRRS